jgi:hypothetical protein
MQSMNGIASLVVAVLGSVSIAAGGPEPLVLTQDGEPKATIVVADEPLPLLVVGGMGQRLLSQRYAAEELQKYIVKISEAWLPIVTATEAPPQGTLILVGRSSLSEQFQIQPPAQPEGLLITDFPRGVAILGEVAPAGTNNWEHEVDRGTLHAVYAFVERYLDLRGYVIDDNLDEDVGLYVPHSPTIALELPIDYRDAPVYAMRTGGGYVPHPRQGSAFLFRGGHTHRGWDKRYAASHPEYFALKEDGSRDFNYLCYTEPGVLASELAHIEEFYSQGEWEFHWVTPNTLYIPALPDDHWPGCQSERCLALGTGSNLWFDYVRRLALAVQERWPGKRIATHAYQSFRSPPDFPLPENVDVMVSMELSTAVSKEPEVYEHNLGLLGDWYEALGQDARRLYVWEYHDWPAAWTHAPTIYPHALQRWLRAARKQMSGEYIVGGGNTPQESHFMFAVWFKLLWNPDLDVDAYLTEYCSRFFGPAAVPIENFYRLLIDRYEQTIWPGVTDDGAQSPVLIYGQTYPPQVIDQLEEFLARAETAVGKLPSRSVEFESEGWMLRRNGGAQPVTYRLALTGLTDEPLVNPTLVWGDNRLSYRGQLSQGHRLVVDPGPSAALYSDDPSGIQVRTDVSGRIEGDVPTLPGKTTEIFHFYGDQPPHGSSVRLTLMDNTTDNTKGTDASVEINRYQERLLWFRRSFEDLHRSTSMWNGHRGFLVAARTVHQHLAAGVSTYSARHVSQPPRPEFADPLWHNADATFLIRGRHDTDVPFDNIGLPADVPTRVQILHDDASIHVAFHCTQPEKPGENDSVALTLFGMDAPLIQVVCRPDGQVESSQAGVRAAAASGEGWWGVFLTLPKTTLSPQVNTYRADLVRERAGKSYCWSPPLRSAPWSGPVPMDSRNLVLFAGQ